MADHYGKRTATRQVRTNTSAKNAAWTGVAVAIAFGLFGTVLSLTGTERDDQALAEKGSKVVTVEPALSPTWITPRIVDDLGTPPPFDLDHGSQESHCDDWHEWLPSVDAAPVGLGHELIVRAPKEAPAVVTRLRARVYRHIEPDAVTIISCQVGAGGYWAHEGSLDIVTPNASLQVSSETESGGSSEFAVPPDSFGVEAGSTEVIILDVQAPSNGFYWWSLTATTIVDQVEHVQELGSREEPFVSYVGPPTGDDLQDAAQRVDWDLVECAWGSPSYGVISGDDPRQWMC